RHTPWAQHADGTPRRAGVSAFGLSGTNAHVILEEAPPVELEPEPESDAAAPLPAWPVLLSAKTDAALRDQADQLRAHLDAHDELALADVAYSLATTRSQFE